MPCRIARRQALALGAAQQRVDHARLVRATQHARGIDRRRQHGVRRKLERVQLREAGEQQRAQLAVPRARRLTLPQE